MFHRLFILWWKFLVIILFATRTANELDLRTVSGWLKWKKISCRNPVFSWEREPRGYFTGYFLFALADCKSIRLYCKHDCVRLSGRQRKRFRRFIYEQHLKAESEKRFMENASYSFFASVGDWCKTHGTIRVMVRELKYLQRDFLQEQE